MGLCRAMQWEGEDVEERWCKRGRGRDDVGDGGGGSLKVEDFACYENDADGTE